MCIILLLTCFSSRQSQLAIAKHLVLPSSQFLVKSINIRVFVLQLTIDFTLLVPQLHHWQNQGFVWLLFIPYALEVTNIPVPIALVKLVLGVWNLFVKIKITGSIGRERRLVHDDCIRPQGVLDNPLLHLSSIIVSFALKRLLDSRVCEYLFGVGPPLRSSL